MMSVITCVTYCVQCIVALKKLHKLYAVQDLMLVLLKEIKLMLPNSQRINRGNYKKTSLTEACIDQKITDLILLKEHRGTPGQPFKQTFTCLTDSFHFLWVNYRELS